MIPSTPQIGISIATKDRWADVEMTLDGLQKEGLDPLETVVVDDGSAVPCPDHLRQKFPAVKFYRYEPSGISAQRNRVIQLLSTPLVLQLDDDSVPIRGDLIAAAAWLAEHPKVCSLAFRIVHTCEVEPPSSTKTSEPFPVIAFVGCGALIRRDLFLALGGFEERFGHSSEEGEYCIKAFQQGYDTYAYPAVIVHHRVTTVGRNRPLRVRQIVRNYMLICLWYYPFPVSYLRALRFAPMQIIRRAPALRDWRNALVGWVQGIVCFLSWPNQRKRLTKEQFQLRDSLRTPESM